MTVGQISRQLSISEQSYYRWRKQYGGMKISQSNPEAAAVCLAKTVEPERQCLYRAAAGNALNLKPEGIPGGKEGE